MRPFFIGYELASPQKEDGYTPISNEIMEALAKTKISGEGRRILDVILRKTYGWDKKTDVISYGQIADLTGISRRSVIRTIKVLKMQKIITSDKAVTRGSVSYGFQKDFEKWQTSVKKATSVKNVTRASVKKAYKTSVKKATHKRKKEKKEKKVVILPDWIDQDLWNDYREYRKSIKSKITSRGEELAILKLTKMREDGENIKEVIEQSIMNGWKGLFEVKGNERPKENIW